LHSDFKYKNLFTGAVYPKIQVISVDAVLKGRTIAKDFANVVEVLKKAVASKGKQLHLTDEDSLFNTF
jgi:hypothetical protein